jgi:predicted ATPase
MTQAISKLTIKGYKSIRSLENFELRNLNILIGPNGSGKSNCINFFQLLKAATQPRRLSVFVEYYGGADSLLYLGSKITGKLIGEVIFKDGEIKWEIELSPTTSNNLIFLREYAQVGNCGLGITWDPTSEVTQTRLNLQSSNKESREYEEKIATPLKAALEGLKFYHFHDTSNFASIKKPTSEGNYDYLFQDASNLAPFLFRMKEKQPRDYQAIIEVVGLAAPFFDDFSFDRNEERGEIKWWWKQKGSDYNFHPSQISDGTLRFICLATALLQPDPPSTILLDEPELGLHPYALTLLAGLIQKASKQTQVIVSTQSAALIDHFEPEDIVIVERQNGESIFKRLNKADLKVWLEDYSLGELWQKNVFGGRPARE